MGSDEQRLWERYEISIHELISALHPQEDVKRNQRVPGQYSKTLRQVDVWATGQVAGLEISVAVECKPHARPVPVGGVDQFVGMLLDLGADRGVLYSYGGFSNSAVMRAINARQPYVMTVALDTPEIVLRNSGAPGYPADLLVQDVAPQWVEEMTSEAFERFLQSGEWSKFWS
jgi:hypothetical protein